MEQVVLTELSGMHLKEVWERKKQEEVDKKQKELQSSEENLKRKIKLLLKGGQQNQSTFNEFDFLFSPVFDDIQSL
ncbi:9716_t:CDS:1, partial [Dentiscutata heterogama]